MLIRKMEEKDIKEVYEIELNSFTQPWRYQDFQTAVLKPDQYYINLYMVAEEEGEILGYCGLWGVAGEGQINNVAVKEEHRGKHIGYVMLKGLIQKGMEYGLAAFTLEVRRSNMFAITLYENLGFQDVGIRKNFYDYPKEDAIIMWLRFKEN